MPCYFVAGSGLLVAGPPEEGGGVLGGGETGAGEFEELVVAPEDE
jgi:hypothetical protein